MSNDTDDDGTWLRERCYECGHRLAFDASHCPQCGERFDGRDDPEPMPDACKCQRCTEARAA